MVCAIQEAASEIAPLLLVGSVAVNYAEKCWIQCFKIRSLIEGELGRYSKLGEIISWVDV